MKTHPIIAELDVPRNILLRLLPRRVNSPVNALDLNRSIERFGQGVIEADPGTPYGLPDPEAFQDRGELRRSIDNGAFAPTRRDMPVRAEVCARAGRVG